MDIVGSLLAFYLFIRYLPEMFALAVRGLWLVLGALFRLLGRLLWYLLDRFLPDRGPPPGWHDSAQHGEEDARAREERTHEAPPRCGPEPDAQPCPRVHPLEAKLEADPCFAVLADQDARPIERKRAYRRLCSAYHPDKTPMADPDLRVATTRCFQRMDALYRASPPVGSGMDPSGQQA